MKRYWYVYIITNYKNTVFYIGITNNLERRVYEHKNGLFDNSFAKKCRLYKLIWFEQFYNPQEARAAEKRIKGWTRKKKIDLIKSINLNLKDLMS